MKRRHLFDHGDPVCRKTLQAGSEVLLALSHQSLRQARVRLASSFCRLADSSALMMDSAERKHVTRSSLSPRADAASYLAYPRERMHCSNQFQSGALRPRLPRS